MRQHKNRANLHIKIHFWSFKQFSVSVYLFAKWDTAAAGFMNCLIKPLRD